MFTGIVEKTGRIESIKTIASGKEFVIRTIWTNPDIKIGDSIAINGACMTVTEFRESGNWFQFYASFQSLALTNLQELIESDVVNLERAMLPTQRYGGHLVQGHVDGKGKILERNKKDDSEEFWVSTPDDLKKYIVKKGSITVDGISLTIVEKTKEGFYLILIPETMKKTNADTWMPGKVVNLEVDILAKYIESYMEIRA